MKHLFFVLLATLLLCSPGIGQIPQLMSHQGYVADSTGMGITGTLPMTFRMFNDSTAGSLLLTQSFPSVALTKGVFNVNINVSTLSFTGQYWLETEVNSQTLAPCTRLTSAPYSLAPWVTNGSSLYYNDGNVGIGTASPAAKLDVTGNVKIADGSQGTGKFLVSNVSGVASWQSLNASGLSGILGVSNGGTGAGALTQEQVIFAGSGGVHSGDNTFTWDNTNKRLGIGTFPVFAPISASLDIRSTVSSDGLRIGDNGSGNTLFKIGRNTSTGNLDFTGLQGSNVGFSFTTGNVGIGTTTPGNRLDIVGAGATLRIAAALNSGYGAIQLGQSATASQNFHVSSEGDGNLRFWNGNWGAGTHLMTVTSGGSVGIGTGTPAYKLEVNGDINAIGSVRSNGTALTSDVRFKKNIATLSNSLERVIALRGVTYDWKKAEFPERKFSDEKQVGFIAQELEKVFPELVSTGADGYKGVDYARLTPVLVEAIKEQQKEIDELKALVKSLAVEKNGVENKSMGEVK